MTSAFNDCALCHQTKTLIDFWCGWGLNLIQLSEILLIELTGTYNLFLSSCTFKLHFELIRCKSKPIFSGHPKKRCVRLPQHQAGSYFGHIKISLWALLRTMPSIIWAMGWFLGLR